MRHICLLHAGVEAGCRRLLLPTLSTLPTLPLRLPGSPFHRAEVERYRAETLAAANDDRTLALRALGNELAAEVSAGLQAAQSYCRVWWWGSGAEARQGEGVGEGAACAEGNELAPGVCMQGGEEQGDGWAAPSTVGGVSLAAHPCLFPPPLNLHGYTISTPIRLPQEEAAEEYETKHQQALALMEAVRAAVVDMFDRTG